MIRDTSASDLPVQPIVRRPRFVLLGTSLLLVLLGLVVAWPSVGRLISNQSAISATRLRIAEVKRGTLLRDVSVQGRVVAAVSPTLYAAAAGTVTFTVNAGDKVEENQILAELDSPELKNKYAQEQANLQSLELAVARGRIESRKQELQTQKSLDQAKVDLSAAQREVERNKQAFNKGAIPELTVLRAEDNSVKAELIVEQAKKEIALEHESLQFDLRTRQLALDRQQLLTKDLKRQVDSLNVRAPVAGQIGQLLSAQKANVVSNAPLLTVVDLSALEIEVQVPETFAHDLGIGMSAEIREGESIYPGSVSALSPEVVNGQVNARVRFSDNKPLGLRQNQRLNTRILIEERADVLVVERGPFVDIGAGHMAYVVKDGVAEKRAIQIGVTALDRVEILSGLEVGEHVVIAGSEIFNDARNVIIH